MGPVKRRRVEDEKLADNAHDSTKLIENSPNGDSKHSNMSRKKQRVESIDKEEPEVINSLGDTHDKTIEDSHSNGSHPPTRDGNDDKASDSSAGNLHLFAAATNEKKGNEQEKESRLLEGAEESTKQTDDGLVTTENIKKLTESQQSGVLKHSLREEQQVVQTPLIAATTLYENERGPNNTIRTSSGRRLTFPEKLMELLNCEECQDAMCWLPNGNAFALHPTIFMNKILPKHFEGTKFESFTRKLNRWGFKRIAGEDAPEDTFAYSHHLFKRDYPELCRGMSGGKKMEQDFSHLIRYREEREQGYLHQAIAANNAGIGGGLGMYPQSGRLGGFGGGIAGLHHQQQSAVMQQQAELQNILLERQLANASAAPYGLAGQMQSMQQSLALEREIALREMMLRQEQGNAAGSNNIFQQQQQRLAAGLGLVGRTGGGGGGSDLDQALLMQRQQQQQQREQQQLLLSGRGMDVGPMGGPGVAVNDRGITADMLLLKEQQEHEARLRLQQIASLQSQQNRLRNQGPFGGL